MTMPAAHPRTVGAAGALPIRMAGQHPPSLRPAGVHAAEAGRGEGHKQPRMLSDRLGDALATLQPGGEELVGISSVGGRTRRAARLPAGAARLQQHPIRLPAAVIHGADLARGLVGLLDPSHEADRAVAVACLGDQLGPAVIARPSAGDDLAQDAREQVCDRHRLAHAASLGSGTTRRPGAWVASSSAGSARSPELARTMAATWW
jgi:hypothetical protein